MKKFKVTIGRTSSPGVQSEISEDQAQFLQVFGNREVQSDTSTTYILNCVLFEGLKEIVPDEKTEIFEPESNPSAIDLNPPQEGHGVGEEIRKAVYEAVDGPQEAPTGASFVMDGDFVVPRIQTNYPHDKIEMEAVVVIVARCEPSEKDKIPLIEIKKAFDLFKEKSPELNWTLDIK
jgi:hypothetical protein